MNIRDQLLKEHSKTNAAYIAQAVVDFPDYLKPLINCFFEPGWRMSQRAVWPLELLAKMQATMLDPYIKSFLDTIENKDYHDAIRRNSVRLLQFLDIPEKHVGQAFDSCYRLLDEPQEAIAIRVFAMTILVNICKKEPELASEVRHTIEKYIPFGSAGFKNRGSKLIHILQKIESEK